MKTVLTKDKVLYISVVIPRAIVQKGRRPSCSSVWTDGLFAALWQPASHEIILVDDGSPDGFLARGPRLRGRVRQRDRRPAELQLRSASGNRAPRPDRAKGELERR